VHSVCEKEKSGGDAMTKSRNKIACVKLALKKDKMVMQNVFTVWHCNVCAKKLKLPGLVYCTERNKIQLHDM